MACRTPRRIVRQWWLRHRRTGRTWAYQPVLEREANQRRSSPIEHSTEFALVVNLPGENVVEMRNARGRPAPVARRCQFNCSRIATPSLERALFPNRRSNNGTTAVILNGWRRKGTTRVLRHPRQVVAAAYSQHGRLVEFRRGDSICRLCMCHGPRNSAENGRGLPVPTRTASLALSATTGRGPK
jgi:hypothetical protein